MMINRHVSDMSVTVGLHKMKTYYSQLIPVNIFVSKSILKFLNDKFKSNNHVAIINHFLPNKVVIESFSFLFATL
jgi:hypothetical protein